MILFYDDFGVLHFPGLVLEVHNITTYLEIECYSMDMATKKQTK